MATWRMVLVVGDEEDVQGPLSGSEGGSQAEDFLRPSDGEPKDSVVSGVATTPKNTTFSRKCCACHTFRHFDEPRNHQAKKDDPTE